MNARDDLHRVIYLDAALLPGAETLDRAVDGAAGRLDAETVIFGIETNRSTRGLLDVDARWPARALPTPNGAHAALVQDLLTADPVLLAAIFTGPSVDASDVFADVASRHGVVLVPTLHEVTGLLTAAEFWEALRRPVTDARKAMPDLPEWDAAPANDPWW
ncbi:hypothetical protein [Microbacterium hominis]|uniref:Uncharacterized protein n=1 Tax=Microbacterium hominis TaxID=162426 RepID=A0A7D4QD72_9MICO|nr:hypothetical protein [Microbacterium hominis]QKJ19917.1 hypothetical protein HQM25_11485 [Microbacterium hominis]